MSGRKATTVLWQSSSGLICSSNCRVCLMSFELSVFVEDGRETLLVTHDCPCTVRWTAVNICSLDGGAAMHSGTDLCQSLFWMFCDPRSTFLLSMLSRKGGSCLSHSAWWTVYFLTISLQHVPKPVQLL